MAIVTGLPHSGIIRLFQLESNKIEGIESTNNSEINALTLFLGLPKINISDLVDYVKVIQPNARARFVEGLDVKIYTSKPFAKGLDNINEYFPPPGGPEIHWSLQKILDKVNPLHTNHPYEIHQEYEALHPFTDGNGRSGRALWAWHMLHVYGPYVLNIGFLHKWYYQSLEFGLSTCKCGGSCNCK